MKPLRVLCVDLEGAHGGSSRSLYFALLGMPLEKVRPVVVCRRGGRVEQLYADAGIECHVEPSLPAVSSLPRLSRNLWVYFQALRRWRSGLPAMRRLAVLADTADVVHFNHEGLFLLARWLRDRVHAPFSMHVRTNLVDGLFARWQTRQLSSTIDERVFITENEEARYRELGGRGAGRVILNPVEPWADGPMHQSIERDAELRIACLSNYSHARGLDRLVDIAMRFDDEQRRRIRFVVAGDMRLGRSEQRRLGLRGRADAQLRDHAERMGVAECFQFLGHVSNPEQVLRACQVLAKPTREYNPWGRDILEAMSAGLAVFSIGRYERFVQSDATGLLQPEFDADAAARWFVELADDRETLARLGAAAAERTRTLCDMHARGLDLLGCWQALAASGRVTP